ncbi:MAG TPA: acyl-CoA dehydrogenase family protein [Actinomycetota bacterium]|jgi:alkylation response protein AidB-like acyl-CoA dehydrogenase|nr:acyl-CoA dehydrogenase family protein [Actinomycetota bacterium]
MEFAFSEEQEMLRESARTYLGRRLSIDRAVEASKSDLGWDAAAWKEISELGWTGLSVAEESGGAGMGFMEEAVLFEELGRAPAPLPYFATVGLALPALTRSPVALRSILSGQAATLAVAEHGTVASLRYPGEVRTSAQDSGGSLALTGTKHVVPDVMTAQFAVVVARIRSSPAVFLVDLTASGVRPEGLSTVDVFHPLGRLALEDAPGEILAGPDAAGDLIARIRMRALAAAALEAVGVATAALELSVSYAKERKQFGHRIGAFQAVAHKAADGYVETELSRSLAYWAAWCVDQDHPHALSAALAAKSFACEAAVACTERAIQIHGGIGFTWEHVLHRLYKRALWLQSFEGHGRVQRRELSALLLG